MLSRSFALWLSVYVCAGAEADQSGSSETPRSIVAIARPQAAEPHRAAGALADAPPGIVPALQALGTWRPLLRHPPCDAELAQTLGLDRAFVLELLPGVDPDAALAALRAQPALFESATAEIGVTACTQSDDGSGEFVPDDPVFKHQYSLLNSGQLAGGQAGTPGADLDMLRAWALSTGGAEVVVAVLDAGISRSHPDLAAQLVPGWNFVASNDQTDDRYTSHGTHTAGIIAAQTSNRTGIASVARDARLMPVVVLNKYGFGNESWLAEGLVWAADHGAKVASVSLGFDPGDGDANDVILRNAVTYATARGMLICASSGNIPGARIGAPARYPEVMAVGATNNRDEFWSDTSTGPEMSVAAPGVAIWSTWDSEWYDPGTDTYAARTGTSQACPHVAGVAALVASARPHLDPLEIRTIIESTAVDLGPPGWDEHFGAGRVNAGAAVWAALHSGDKDLGQQDTLCIADFNNDGLVDSRDFVDYLQAFADRSWRADLAEPRGVFNTMDVLTYLRAYAAGCES